MGMYAQIAMMAVSAAGKYQAGLVAQSEARGQANVAEYNAKVKRNEARAIEQRTIVQSQKQAEEGARRVGTMRTMAAKGGAVITEGSPLLAVAEQEIQNVNENQMIGYKGVVDMQTAENQAVQFDTQAKIHKKKEKHIGQASVWGMFGGGGGSSGGGMGSMRSSFGKGK